MSLAANMLANSRKIWHITKGDSVKTRLACCLWNGPLKRYFLHIYLATFSETIISEMQNLCVSYFFSKCSRSNPDFRNAEKDSENFFCFWDNIIWIGIFNLSLLRTGYLPSAANILKSSPKTWHVNKRYFFQLNYLQSNQ